MYSQYMSFHLIDLLGARKLRKAKGCMISSDMIPQIANTLIAVNTCQASLLSFPAFSKLDNPKLEYSKAQELESLKAL